MIRTAPAFLRYAEWAFFVEARTRGSVRDRGEGLVQRGRGARVKASVSVPAMSLVDARKVRAWLHSLRGNAIATYLRIPHGFAPDAAITSYTATGSGAAGSATITAASALTNLSAGMWLSLDDGRQLCAVTAIDGSAITVTPALRFAFDGVLSWGEVYGVFRLEDDTPVIPFSHDRSEPFDISFVETINERPEAERLLGWQAGVAIDFGDQSAVVILSPEPESAAAGLLGGQAGVAIDFGDQSAIVIEAD